MCESLDICWGEPTKDQQDGQQSIYIVWGTCLIKGYNGIHFRSSLVHTSSKVKSNITNVLDSSDY